MLIHSKHRASLCRVSGSYPAEPASPPLRLLRPAPRARSPQGRGPPRPPAAGAGPPPARAAAARCGAAWRRQVVPVRGRALGQSGDRGEYIGLDPRERLIFTPACGGCSCTSGKVAGSRLALKTKLCKVHCTPRFNNLCTAAPAVQGTQQSRRHIWTSCAGG
jgi:hypothetical protein